jgi:hypothetical protein
MAQDEDEGTATVEQPSSSDTDGVLDIEQEIGSLPGVDADIDENRATG